MNPLDTFYLSQAEPDRSCMMALRDIILGADNDIEEAWKYKLPFFTYKNKMVCYLWKHKKHKQPYIGIVEGHLFNEPYLVKEKRAKMQIMLINPLEDLPKDEIEFVITRSVAFLKSK